jgi:Flp pilus assembly protein TadB
VFLQQQAQASGGIISFLPLVFILGLFSLILLVHAVQ